MCIQGCAKASRKGTQVLVTPQIADPCGPIDAQAAPVCRDRRRRGVQIEERDGVASITVFRIPDLLFARLRDRQRSFALLIYRDHFPVGK